MDRIFAGILEHHHVGRAAECTLLSRRRIVLRRSCRESTHWTTSYIGRAAYDNSVWVVNDVGGADGRVMSFGAEEPGLIPDGDIPLA